MKVSGTISDAYGKTDGATIQLHRQGEPMDLGVISNQNGYFEIENADIQPNDDFVISFLGLKNQVKKAKDLQNAQIFLEEDIEALDEVIVTANIGKTPKIEDIKVDKYKEKWYTSPPFVLGSLGLFTAGIILFVIKKTR